MTDLWLPNATKHKFAFRGGFKYDRTTDKKIVLHTTEGGSIAGALSAYKRYPPHLITSWKEKKTLQHVPLNLASYSLKSTESEDEPVIQVEIVGFAREARNWTKDQLDWLVDEIMVPVHQMWPYDLQGPPQGFKDEKDGIVLASAKSPIRFSMSDWEKFSGIIGHQHAPSPDTHWDPGAVNVAYLISETTKKLRGTIATPQAPQAPAKETPKVATAEHVEKMKQWFPIIFDRNADEEGASYWAEIMSASGWNTAFDGLRTSFEGKFRQAVRDKANYDGIAQIKAMLLKSETSKADTDKQLSELRMMIEHLTATINSEIEGNGRGPGETSFPEEITYVLKNRE